jgi:hypothetical protein
VKFWQDGTHANHGFFLYGDSNDYLRMYTPQARNLKPRPALLVVYEPKPQTQRGRELSKPYQPKEAVRCRMTLRPGCP